MPAAGMRVYPIRIKSSDFSNGVYLPEAGLSIWQLIFYNKKLPGIFLYRNNIQMTKKAI